MPSEPSCIWVIAGVNGAGKSSLLGAVIREGAGFYYNPDEAAARMMAVVSGLDQGEANSLAWRQGVRLLRQAIDQKFDFAFETTLGGNTIVRLLKQAAASGSEVHLSYVGLANVELHIDRVRRRVKRGGHDIPEADIRRRYEYSRLNLIELSPYLSSLSLFDNSIEGDPAIGKSPHPMLLLRIEKQRLLETAELAKIPKWAKPIVAAALRLNAQHRGR